MNYFERRQLKKTVHLARHMVRHALNMREDAGEEAALAGARAAERNLQDAWRARDWGRMEAACEQAAGAAERLMPPRSFPKWRENVEVLVVAISLAMACRTYFIQPFKIPTGSMQPTLYGVTARPQEGKQWFDRFPVNLVNLALFGERYVIQGATRARWTTRARRKTSMRSGWGAPLIAAHDPETDSFLFDPAQSMKLHAHRRAGGEGTAHRLAGSASATISS
jgi:hypothetical protein